MVTMYAKEIPKGSLGTAKLYVLQRTLKLGEVSVSSSDIKEVLDEKVSSIEFYPVSVEPKGMATGIAKVVSL